MTRKTIRRILITLGIALLIVPFFFMNMHHRRASDYQKVLKYINIEIPEITHVESINNYDRGSSRWDCLEYELHFESLPESTVQKLERYCERNSHWTKNDTINKIVYEYRSEPEWESDLYFISCSICEDTAWIEYYIDEDEGIFCILIPFAAIFLGFVGLVVWLLINVIVNIFKKIFWHKNY